MDKTKANVLLVGAGGVGTMAAFALERGGKAMVTAVLRSNYTQVAENGFQIKSIDHGDIQGWRPSTIRRDIPDVQAETLAPYDFIVVATKNIPDVPPTVTEIIEPAVTPGRTIIVLLQNGLNIEKPVLAAFPQSPVLSGISLIGAIEQPVGVIKHDDHDILIVGAFTNPNIPLETSEAAAKRFVDMYSSCSGVQCTYDADVAFCRWRKLLYNSSFNSAAAILHMDTGRMRLSESVIDDLIRPIMLEIVATAKAAGVLLPVELVEKMITIDPYDAFLQPSMMQDAAKGNFMEVENIVGEPLRVAEGLGVSTPTLKVVYGLLKGMQWQTKERKGMVVVPPASVPWMKYG